MRTESLRAVCGSVSVLALTFAAFGQLDTSQATTPDRTQVAHTDPRFDRDLTPPPPEPGENIVPDPSPGLNSAAWTNSMRPPKRRFARQATPSRLAPSPGTGDRGFYILGSQNIDRIYALQDVFNEVRLPASPTNSGLWLYAPTMAMPDATQNRLGCLEVVTLHFRKVTMNSTAHQFGVWDHCTLPRRDDFVYTRNLDSGFVSTYGGSYLTGIVRAGTVWQALLFNRLTAQWEAVWTLDSALTSDPVQTTGWTIFETYGFSESHFCPPLPSIGSHDIWVHKTSDTWSHLLPGMTWSYIPFAYCFDTPGQFAFQTLAPNYDWRTVANTERVPTGGNLLPGQYLYPSQGLYSSNGQYLLYYQTDGNLVLYGPSGYLWASWTFGAPGFTVMQWDGNFVVYNASQVPVFHTGTWTSPGAFFRVADDGHIAVLGANSVVLWRQP